MVKRTKILLSFIALLASVGVHAQDAISQGTFFITAGGPLVYFGSNFEIDAGTTTNNDSIVINGNWENNSTYTAGASARTNFVGSTAQTIGGTSQTTFNHVEFNNTHGTNPQVTLNTTTRVGSFATFTDGVVASTTSELLIFNNGSDVNGTPSDASHVDGPVEKVGTDAFNFPVGDDDNYQLIGISAPSVATDVFRAQYREVNPDDVPYDRGSREVGLDHVSGCEHWTLDRTVGSSNVSVTLQWDGNSCGVTNLADLVVARWGGGTEWKNEGQSANTGNTTTGTVTSAAAVTTFGPFTLASITAANPLPIELVYFGAELNGDVVDLTWQTRMERNNEKFVLQKSSNGVSNWESFAEQPGTGDQGSNTLLNYYDVDYNPYIGLSYYRLKQVDQGTGTPSYSNVVPIHYSKGKEIYVYPNPVRDILTIANLEEEHVIKVYSISGQIVYNGNTNRVNTSAWSKGVYELIIYNIDGRMEEKIRVVKS